MEYSGKNSINKRIILRVEVQWQPKGMCHDKKTTGNCFKEIYREMKVFTDWKTGNPLNSVSKPSFYRCLGSFYFKYFS